MLTKIFSYVPILTKTINILKDLFKLFWAIQLIFAPGPLCVVQIRETLYTRIYDIDIRQSSRIEGGFSHTTDPIRQVK